MKLKKFLSIFITSAVVFHAVNLYFVPLRVNSYIFAQDSSEALFDFDLSTGTITKYKGTESNVTIPQEISGVDVVAIGKQAFAKNTSIVTLKLNEGIVSIGEGAFAGATNLTNIEFPSSLKKIGKLSFAKTKISNLQFNEGLEVIGQSAFSNCSNLTNVILPNSLLQIENKAFEKCNISSMSSFGSNIGHIGHQVIKGNNNTTLSIGNSLGNKIYIHDEVILGHQNTLVVPQNREVTILARAFYNTGQNILDTGEVEVNSTDTKEEILAKINYSVKLKAGFAIIDKSGNMANDIYVEKSPTWNLDNLDLSGSTFDVTGKFILEDSDFISIANKTTPNKDVTKTAIQTLVSKVRLKINQVVEPWDQEDFTYSDVEEKLISKNYYFAITGLSDSGKEKIKRNKNLVLPASIQVEENGQITYKNIEGIGVNAFRELGLESVEIAVPIGYKEYFIDDNAFIKNNLSKIDIPNGVKFIEAFAFNENKLVNLEIPESVLKIGNESFANNQIENLIISDQVEKIQIDSYSFKNNKLKEVSLPYSIFKLLENVFPNNPGLENGKVILYTRNPLHFDVSTYIKPNSPHHIMKLVSPNVSRSELQSLLEIVKRVDRDEYTKDSLDKLLTTYENAKVIHQKSSSSQAEINAIVEKLREDFNNLESTGLNKKNLIQEIERLSTKSELLYTEESFKKLAEAISYAEKVVDNKQSTKEEIDKALSKLWDTESGLLVREEAKYNVEDFIFDGEKILGFSESGKEKFSYNKNLILPKKNKQGELIKEISDSAFEYTGEYNYTTDTGYSLYGLENVIIPESVTKIGANAFKNNKLKNVELPNGLISIGSTAFNGNLLEKISIPDSVTEMGSGVFSLNKLTQVKLSKSMKKIPDGIFSRNITLTEVEIPDGVEVIGKYAFIGAPLKEINLPNTLKEVEERAFSSHRTTTIVFPDSLEKIGRESFSSNKKFRYLKNVVINSSLKEIGKDAFKSCLIENITIPHGLEVLHKDAFNDNMNDNKEKVVTNVYSTNKEHEKFISNHHKILIVDVSVGALRLEISKASKLKNTDLYVNSSIDTIVNFDKILANAILLFNKPYDSNIDSMISSIKLANLSLGNPDLSGLVPSNSPIVPINPDSIPSSEITQDNGMDKEVTDKGVNKGKRKVLPKTGEVKEDNFYLTLGLLLLVVIFSRIKKHI